ncbi:hypothetical protein OWV82_008126 [Melia azedarach]|uniref:Uncharacterized protein n=1 Tax=Melia azedarach TaxID=155640 RepID=A0ACC1Y911_MELAZ|nr:hypothetical protein OWV82_008126 [Melia azedarach]
MHWHLSQLAFDKKQRNKRVFQHLLFKLTEGNLLFLGGLETENATLCFIEEEDLGILVSESQWRRISIN